MRKSVLILASFASLVCAQTQTFTYSYTGLPLPVYPSSWNTWSIINIFVPNTLAVTKVTASVQVQYGGVGDLNVYLWSARGTRTKLLERNCGSLLNINTTFDDSAATRFSSSCPQAGGSGSYQGNEPLANSVGQNSYGNWRLGVENNGSANTGLFTGFSITITGTTLLPPYTTSNNIVSVSSFNSGAVAPGDAIAILGSNLGPTPGVTAPAGAPFPTNLGGTQVTFDGNPVPLYAASGGFVVLQAPTTLAAGHSTSIIVTTSTGSTVPIAVPIVSTNPGIFTADIGGQGLAKAINQDGTQNGDGTITGSDIPAPAGSVVAVYASGLGPVSPAIPAGTPAPSTSLSTTTLPVTATIGSQPATVLFAGAAPGEVGVYQVNIQVPASTPSGAARLVIIAGGNVSQSGVTIQVK